MMKPAHKKTWYVLMILWVLISISIMTNSLLRIGGDTKDLFFDQRFLFLEGFAVNDFLPVFVTIYVVLGYSSVLWLTEILIQKERRNFRWVIVAVIPFAVILASLFLFKLGADHLFERTVYKTIAYSFVQFFGAGIYLGIATQIWYQNIHRSQEVVSQ